MRSRLGLPPRLPWALALFVPLLLVAVLGGIELQRQSARVADAVQQQAATFLQGARRHFETQVLKRVGTALHGVQLHSANLVAQTRTASEQDARVLDLFCLDGKGQLVHPRLAMPRELAVPFLTPPTSGEIRLAEHLLVLGDLAALQRCRTILERYLRQRPAATDERARAAFRLGTALRRLGDVPAAEAAYLEARLAALQSEPSSVGIDLLTRLAIAELSAQRDGLLELAREISENAWFAVPDELAGAVFARALASLPADGADGDAAVAELRAQEAVRRNGRRLAVEYERFAAPALQRVLADAPATPVLRSLGGGVDCALLALRPTVAEEQGAAGRSVRWLGLRIDLPGLINDAMDEFLTPGRDAYRLAVLDPDGSPILGEGADQGSSTPQVPTLAGLVLCAVPVDPAASLREERAAVRNRVLLLAALLALALGGGFLLVRSASREAEVSALKMEFVSRMSHELKTPLALIKMYGETLALHRARDTAQAAHFGDIVAREADRLTSQIERILAFSQQQSGTLRYAPRQVDLRHAVADMVAEYRDHVERNRCTLAADGTEPELGVLLADVDPHALHLALVSLVENAVKYTPKDQADRSITVTVARAGDRAVIAVHDRGIGIPDGERERVFEAFHRAANAGEVRGAGLGLVQVQHFVRAHGGDVAALSRPGGGSTLRLRLPLLSDPPTNDRTP